jgi:hypothetical protein
MTGPAERDTRPADERVKMLVRRHETGILLTLSQFRH